MSFLLLFSLVQCFCALLHVLRQHQHFHVFVFVETRLNIHDQLALEGAVLFLSEVVQFLDLGLELGVLGVAGNLVGSLQESLVHRQLGLIFQGKIGRQVQSALLALVVIFVLSAEFYEFLNQVVKLLVKAVQVQHFVVVILEVVFL